MEVLATMAIVTIAIVGMVSDFAAAERTSGDAVTQAQAEVQMRQVTDALRDKAVTYVPCATTSTSAYAAKLPNSSWSMISVSLLSGSTTTPATAAYWDCTTNNAVNGVSCPGNDVCDFGVQRLAVLDQYSGGSLLRTVFKGKH
jgi:hypothetical protein